MIKKNYKHFINIVVMYTSEKTADTVETIITEIGNRLNLFAQNEDVIKIPQKKVRLVHFHLRKIINREQYSQFYFDHVCAVLGIPNKVPRKRIKHNWQLKYLKHVTKSQHQEFPKP
jgi:hypothetical protein